MKKIYLMGNVSDEEMVTNVTMQGPADDKERKC